jgi:hypothetical protein
MGVNDFDHITSEKMTFRKEKSVRDLWRFTQILQV